MGEIQSTATNWSEHTTRVVGADVSAQLEETIVRGMLNVREISTKETAHRVNLLAIAYSTTTRATKSMVRMNQNAPCGG